MLPSPPIRLIVVLAAVTIAITAAGHATAAKARVVRDGAMLTLENGRVSVQYNLERGLADYTWGPRTVIRNAYSTATLPDQSGRKVTTFQGGQRHAVERSFSDAIGSGTSVRVTTTIPEADVALIQQFFLYDDETFLTQRTSIARLTAGGAPVRTDLIEVVAAGVETEPKGSVSIEPVLDQRFYQAPFYNNDDFAVIPRDAAKGAVSYWLGGVIDAGVGHGLIAGAVETGVWKPTVWYDGPTGAFSARSALRSPVDSVAAAPRGGHVVDSALTYLGYREVYKDALADLMRAIGGVEPPLAAPDMAAPIGWSAWYQHGVATNEATVRGVTDFIADNWARLGYRYINLDAGWNRADGDTRFDPAKFPGGIEPLVQHIHNRGLLAGGYFVPFAISPSLLDQQAPGSDYRYRDMLVRNEAGEPIRASILDWEYVLDTTHPGARPLLYALARQIATYGFDFVKLDFLHIGTQAGLRHDPSVTAMEAFHLGMRAIRDAWRDSGRPIYLSAAISPLYVQSYVHARRVGNDVEFGQVRQAKNVALSWFTGLLYDRNDPDNAVVRRSWYPGYNDDLAKLHVTMDALGGTLFIAGDDPRELSPQRAALLTNRSVLALARQPLVIRPLGVAGTPPPIWHAPESGDTHIVGVFNWSGTTAARHTIRFADLGLDPRRVYTTYDLWAQHSTGTHESSFTVELPPHGVALIRIFKG